MEFWASSEVYKPAAAASEKVRRIVEKYLNEAFKNSSLEKFDCRIRYVPIIMPPSMRENYPARSKLSRKSRTYDCAPHLDYDIFVDGALSSQVKAYVEGIAESSHQLSRFGATADQVAEFDKILARAVACIVG